MNEKDAKEKMKKLKENRKLRDHRSDAAEEVAVEAAVEAAEKPVSPNRAIFRRLTLGGLLAAIFLLLYIPSLMTWLSGGTIAQDILRIGTIEESINANGVLIRDEVLIESPALEGRVIAEIAEGEKTPAYSLVATVLNSKSDTLLQEMEEINRKIVKARLEKAEKADFFSEDLVKLDEEIGRQVSNIIAACNIQSFSDIGRYRQEIGKIVEKKAEIVGENTTDSYIKSLKQQKLAVQNKLKMNTVQVVSNVSGIVSYIIDGYETVLTPKNIESLKPAQLDKISKDYANYSVNDGGAQAGKPLVKVIRSNDLYIASVISAAEAKNFKAGDSIKIRINDIGLETNGEVISSGQADKDGRVVLVVMSNRGSDQLSSSRVVNMDFIKKNEEGLKVPLRSLLNISHDGTTAELMLVKYNVAALRKVEILSRDEEYAIIRTPENEIKQTVNLYDTYILNPEKIKEGEIVGK